MRTPRTGLGVMSQLCAVSWYHPGLSQLGSCRLWRPLISPLRGLLGIDQDGWRTPPPGNQLEIGGVLRTNDTNSQKNGGDWPYKC
jgi:hypothetical protein